MLSIFAGDPGNWSWQWPDPRPWWEDLLKTLQEIGRILLYLFSIGVLFYLVFIPGPHTMFGGFWAGIVGIIVCLILSAVWEFGKDWRYKRGLERSRPVNVDSPPWR